MVDESEDRFKKAYQDNANLTVFINELEQEREAIFDDILDVDVIEASKRLAVIDSQIVAAKFIKRLHRAKKEQFMKGYRAKVAANL